MQPDNRDLLAQIVRNNPIATFVLDADHRVTHWNRACEAATGTPAGQVLGTVTFTLGGEELGKYSLTAPDSVPALTFGIIFRRILASLCGRVQ